MLCIPYVKPVNQITFLCHLITTSAVTDCSYDQSEVISLSADTLGLLIQLSSPTKHSEFK